MTIKEHNVTDSIIINFIISYGVSTMITPTRNRIFILMGVAGSGKSAVASALSCELSAAVLDGDFLHPRANINKMAAGYALNDNDRSPWLSTINDAAFAMQRTNTVSIIGCSALKKHHRDRLREGNNNLSFIYLRGHFNVIEARIKARKGHFFKPEMLASQFEMLEECGTNEPDIHIININHPLTKVISDTLAWIISQTKVLN